MRAIDRKWLRDLWHMRGAALAIALVLAAGVASYLMFLITLYSLEVSVDSFYRNYRFAEIFAPLKRAPQRLRERILEIPGVNQVDTRILAYVTVDVAGFSEPVMGLVTSLPDSGEPVFDDLYLYSGRRVRPGNDDEVVVSQKFAEANGFRLGDRLGITIRGKHRQLTVVGTAVSPEYIHQLRPGGVFPDYRRFGVFWMAREPLAAANDMEGAFNYTVLSLERGIHPAQVIERLDLLLAPYGGTGAITREHQQSHRYLAQELQTLRSLVGVFPAIFMGVAAFLLNVVVNRLVSTQREQIATLKAFGYGNSDIAFHFMKMVMVIVLVGTTLGTAGGMVLGYWFSDIYQEQFALPYLTFRVHAGIIASAFLISTVAALLGTSFAVSAAARLHPADALRAEAPAVYRATIIERSGLQRLMGQPTRMIVRHLSHRPFKSLLAIIGVAFAVGISMTGRFQSDSVNHSMYLQFNLAQRDDLTLAFVDPTSRRVIYDLLGLPGVQHAEGMRWIPIRIRHGTQTFRTGVIGLEPDAVLQQVFDEYALKRVEIPAGGIVINDYLARELGIEEGDQIAVEFLDGRRPVRTLEVLRLLPKVIGIFAYMDLETLNRTMQEGHAVSGANLAIDERFADEIYARIKEMPRIAGIGIRVHEIENFHRTMDQTMLFFTLVATVFSVIIAFGIVYNAARITLTERSRELASLRVLGFTRGEISYILLGELGTILLLAVPLGLLIGYGLCWYIAFAIGNELYRVPLVIEPNTYAFAASVVLGAGMVSALLMRRHLDRLDLIGVLKTRE